MLNLIQNLSPLKRYQRRGSVYFPDRGIYVPYPLQHHLDCLDRKTKKTALSELYRASSCGRTMGEWLQTSFGKTLYDLFFAPFHEAYTAGLYDRIAPQDSYKSPAKPRRGSRALENQQVSAGYNVTFVYPKKGLNALTQRMAKECDIYYGQRVQKLT